MMKKQLIGSKMNRNLIVAAILPTLLVACSKDNQNKEVINTPVVTFSARIVDEQPGVKTYLTENVKTNWKTNDEINVFNNGSSYKFKTSGYGQSASFVFIGEGDLPSDIASEKTCALYPYNGSASISEDVISSTVSNVQYVDYPGSFSDTKPVMIAKSGKDGILNFFNACPVIKFTIPSDQNVTEVIFKGNNDNTEKIAGDFNINVSNLAVSGATEAEIKLYKNEKHDAFDSGTYYITMLPNTLTELRLNWNDPNSWGETWRYVAGSFNMQRNKIYDLGNIVTQDNDDPTVSIEGAVSGAVGEYSFSVTMTDNFKLGSFNLQIMKKSEQSEPWSKLKDVWINTYSGKTSAVYNETYTFTEAGEYQIFVKVQDRAKGAANEASVSKDITIL